MQIKSYTVSRNVYFLLEKGIVFVEDVAGEVGEPVKAAKAAKTVKMTKVVKAA